MGQTLTHGVYLPDEGERNCYSGLAGNWQLLDGAVGTIAEHTTALSEKAPLVHTHTKSDITDFPVYGTTAGTICEGNDSRLSDARTPVAHTHGKADITDLFNSANTWTGNQTYNKTTISNAAEVLHCKNANVALGETPASDYQKLFMFKDKNNDNFGYYRHLYQTTGSSQFDILVRNKFTNGAPDTSGSIDYLSFSLRLNADKSKEGVLMGSFKPSNTNTYDLGSSSYKWKTLNGINPGALSLPNLNYSDTNQWISISGNITDETGGSNEYDPAVDGWVVIRADNNPTSLRINVHAPRPSARKYVASATGVAIDGTMIVSVPAPAGSRVYIYFNKGSGSLDSATFITCQGNV